MLQMTKPNDTAERPLVSRVYAFGSERRGGVLFPFALISAVLFFSIGMAIDYSRLVSERERGQIALDAAVLGYVRQYINTQNKQNVTDYARGLADANDGSNLHWNWAFQDAVLSETEIQLSATGTATFSNTVMRIFGYNTVDLQVSSYARAYIPAVSIALVPDISWTMRGARLAALQTALHAFSASLYSVDSIFADKLAVNIVPYSDTVNVSAIENAKKLVHQWEYRPDDTKLPKNLAYYRNILAAEGEYKHVQTPLPDFLTGVPQLIERRYQHLGGSWVFQGITDMAQAWSGCLQTWEEDITSAEVPSAASRAPFPPARSSGYPLCPDAGSRMVVGIHGKSELDSIVDGLTIGFGTSHDIGLLWAQRSLTPEWANFFGIESRPWNNSKEFPKYVIHLTDGQANTFLTRFEQGWRTDPKVNVKMLDICGELKSKGVKIYTIAYELATDYSDFLRSCASDGSFYSASQSNVKDVFQSIADKIKSQNLRIAGQTTVN